MLIMIIIQVSIDIIWCDCMCFNVYVQELIITLMKIDIKHSKRLEKLESLKN